MCKRQAGEKLLEEEKGLEGLIDDIGEDHAKLILDRLELLSKLREIVKNPKLDERLKHCENNLDTPDWWESGKHDRELLRAVLKYGLYRSDQFILNDPDFPFAEAEKNYVRSLEVLKSLKFDNPADLFKLAMGEIPTKVEKKEDATTIETTESPTKSEEIVETEKESVDVEEKPKEASSSDECETEKKLSDESSGETSTAEVSPVEKPSEDVDEKVEEPENKPEVSEESKNGEEKMEVEETVPSVVDENLTTKEATSEEKMEVDEEKPKTPVTVETSEENPASDEKPLEAVEKSADEKMEDENQDKPSDEKTEEENKSVVETEQEKEVEKEEILQADEEKPEPKIDDEKSADETVEKSSETPEKVVEVEESSEKIIKPEDIKEEPGVERTGEPKIVDTVVIEDDETSTEKPTEEKKTVEEITPKPSQISELESLMKMKQFDAMMMKGDMKDSLKSLSRVFDTSMVVKWFRDFALEKRISHIIYCVEKGTWPVGKSYSAYSGCLGIDLDLPLYETVKRINGSDDKRSSSNTPDIITITTDHQLGGKSSLSALQSQLHQSMSALAKQSKKGQKRHIAIDVETERAKLHALLNNSSPMGANAKANWHEDEQELRRAGQSLQPPPAHQPSARNLDRYKPTVTIPGTSSTLTPIDLSSR